jgi:hypothetical protein
LSVENCVLTADFSVGEIMALVFAGCMIYEDGLRLTKPRAEAMQSGSNEVNSGMMSIFFNRTIKLTLTKGAEENGAINVKQLMYLVYKLLIISMLNVKYLVNSLRVAG